MNKNFYFALLFMFVSLANRLLKKKNKSKAFSLLSIDKKNPRYIIFNFSFFKSSNFATIAQIIFQ